MVLAAQSVGTASADVPTVVPATASARAVRLAFQQPGIKYWTLPVTRRVVALTFDAGSDLGYTAMILDTLKAEGVHATFGITGDWATAHPEMVIRMASEGHEVMNHSMHHYSFTTQTMVHPLLSRAARQADVREADAVFARLIGHTTAPFWRPPYGAIDASVEADLGAIGYRYIIMWTIDTLGWNGMSRSGIVSRVASRAVPGAIIAGHVGSQSQDGPALRAMIDVLRAQGYGFITVGQAFGM
jgi:peptidoglycan/xylan/chitin deacetylase (PgdA/CDA1 family)